MAAASSNFAAWMRAKRSGAEAELSEAFYVKTALAESMRPRESAACTRLQSAWRGRMTRVLIAYWAHHGLIVERIARGHLGRQRARRLRIERDTQLQREFFDSFATTIQLRFRGFHSRKYLHNFYARKAYVDAVLRKGESLKGQLQRSLEQQVAEITQLQETKGRETVTRLATRLHHLRSTASCAGIYNSPYHVGYHPTAFGVPVEDHLRNAVRPLIKTELRKKKLVPVGSLPPIKPRNMHEATYPEMQQEERQEKWLSKTTRMAQEDFVTATGKRPLVYPGSVHTGGVGYHPPPASLDRQVDREKWISDQTFKSAVPTGKMLGTKALHDPAADKYEQKLAMTRQMEAR